MTKGETHEIINGVVEMHKYNMTMDKRKRHDNNEQFVKMIISIFHGVMDDKRVQLIIAFLLFIKAYKVYKEEKRKDKREEK